MRRSSPSQTRSMLRERKLARPLSTQTYQAPYNQEYCCLFAIKRAIVDSQPDKAALIVRAFRQAKHWVAQNPMKAVVAAQAAGYYSAAAPLGPSANAAASFGFDREVDLAPMLEQAFKEGSKRAPSRPIRPRRSWSASTTDRSSKSRFPVRGPSPWIDGPRGWR